MSASQITDDLRRFVLTSIPSVPYLEAILLLRGSPTESWDTGELARRLYVREKLAGELIAALIDAGIAQPDGGAPPKHTYRPASPELAQRLDALAAAYSAHLVEITDLIHSRTDKRAQQFADAFRLRKD